MGNPTEDALEKRVLEHFTLEMLCKDLGTNPCRQIVVGELCLPLNDYLTR